MGFGCCVNLLATPDDPVGLQWLERVVAVGFDYVELPVAEMMLLDDTAFADLVHRLKALELRCMSCNNFSPSICGLLARIAENIRFVTIWLTLCRA